MRRTKIICTLGPATASLEKIRALACVEFYRAVIRHEIPGHGTKVYRSSTNARTCPHVWGTRPRKARPDQSNEAGACRSLLNRASFDTVPEPSQGPLGNHRTP